MKNCLFCKIVANEAPSVLLFEDDLVVSFLDIAPINFGHALVIPKEHHQSLTTASELVQGRMMAVASKIGIALQRELDADGFNLHLANGTCAGQVIGHTHLHVIPRFPTDGFSWGWRAQAIPDDAAAFGEAVAARLSGKPLEK